MSGTLYLVPNTLDLGTAEPPSIDHALPREVMRRAAGIGHWIVEDAKTARALLKRLGALEPLKQPLQALSIVELPRPGKGGARSATSVTADALLAPALAGHDMGLLSEAGLPAVADPGAGVVATAHRLGVRVVPLAGPSALLLALAASGLEGQRFAFVGYVPQEAPARAARLRELEQRSRRERETQILIETPYRNAALLAALVDQLHPSSRLSVSVGLTLEGGFTRSDSIVRWRERPAQLPADLPAVFCFLAG